MSYFNVSLFRVFLRRDIGEGSKVSKKVSYLASVRSTFVDEYIIVHFMNLPLILLIQIDVSLTAFLSFRRLWKDDKRIYMVIILIDRGSRCGGVREQTNKHTDSLMQ